MNDKYFALRARGVCGALSGGVLRLCGLRILQTEAQAGSGSAPGEREAQVAAAENAAYHRRQVLQRRNAVERRDGMNAKEYLSQVMHIDCLLYTSDAADE